MTDFDVEESLGIMTAAELRELMPSEQELHDGKVSAMIDSILSTAERLTKLRKTEYSVGMIKQEQNVINDLKTRFETAGYTVSITPTETENTINFTINWEQK
jgi:hypothetical protein